MAKIRHRLHVLEKAGLSPKAFGRVLDLIHLNLILEADFFNGFTKRHPVYAPFTTPVYSNTAFQILGYVIENVTGQAYEEAVETDIFKPLNLSRTSLKRPGNPSWGVIPVGDSWWDTEQGGQSSYVSIPVLLFLLQADLLECRGNIYIHQRPFEYCPCHSEKHPPEPYPISRVAQARYAHGFA